MRVAFYAPLKPPDHPVPSGDRRMARTILGLLDRLGHTVVMPSRLRTYDRDGDQGRQERLASLCRRLAERVAHRLHGTVPQAWITYHCYHKAPDLIGPVVAELLDLPYLIIEPSIAPRQATGPWASGYNSALSALRRADLLLPVTDVDAQMLARAVVPRPAIRPFPPFLDAEPLRVAAASRSRHRQQLAQRLGLDPARPWLLTVAMMRRDIKRDSYLAQADALERIGDRPWHLLVAGSGEAEAEIRERYAAIGVGRVAFLGALDSEALAPLYAAADMLVWPAFREAYGLAILEAQAAGLPVIACREGGVAEVVADGTSGLLVPGRDMAELADAIATLLDDPDRRCAMSAAAAARVAREHDLPVAAGRLRDALQLACEAHASRRRSATCHA